MNAGRGLQQVGFALRPGLTRDCGHALDTLMVGGQGRAGLQLTISLPGFGNIELLAVHLKSGCARESVATASEACVLLAAQAQALGRWIAARASRKDRFIVLGDFNRGGPPNLTDHFWRWLDPANFQTSSAALPFSNCVWGRALSRVHRPHPGQPESGRRIGRHPFPSAPLSACRCGPISPVRPLPGRGFPECARSLIVVTQ